MELGSWGLVVVDLQRYYIESSASFVRYFDSVHPGATRYVSERCHDFVIPNLVRVRRKARELGCPVIYLRLCGKQPDRSDLHRHFLKVYREALEAGFPDLYPLQDDPLASVVTALSPGPEEYQICKTTYSGFTSSPLETTLRELGLQTLVMTGLATSQCVETTARDASDRGFRIVHLDDCQADYHDVTHRCSLFSSRAVCGGHIVTAREFLEDLL